MPQRLKFWRDWRTSKVIQMYFPAAVKGAAIGGLNKVWFRVRAAANLHGVRLHDLRHSFASMAVAGGLERKPPKVISLSDPCSAWTAKANKRVQFGYG
jgi:integrase